MPSLRADAPAGVPNRETLEYLLRERNRYSKATSKTKPFQELTPEEKQATGFVTLRKRNNKINGDPFGLLTGWAGNVGHPYDERMVSQCLRNKE